MTAVPDVSIAPANAVSSGGDELCREVFGFLGLAVDALNFDVLLRSIYRASNLTAPYLISTPNVNFLVASRINPYFRESLLRSNLCIADGMPLIWIAKFLRIPIRERVTGADLFEILKRGEGAPKRLRVFLFGGAEGLASVVADKLNLSNGGLECVGSVNPGFGSIEEMSRLEVIDAINASGADLLAVFLGAEKAQTWLLRNHHRIKVPLRAQFGAAINFEAGTVKRAPALLRNSGFEWMWRIKEEPYLWRRYWRDGKVLTNLFLTKVLPLAFHSTLHGARRGQSENLEFVTRAADRPIEIALSGPAIARHVERAAAEFRSVLALQRDVVLDCSNLSWIDQRFIGLLLMLRKELVSKKLELRFARVPRDMRRLFGLNGFEFLLAEPQCLVIPR